MVEKSIQQKWRINFKNNFVAYIWATMKYHESCFIGSFRWNIAHKSRNLRKQGDLTLFEGEFVGKKLKNLPRKVIIKKVKGSEIIDAAIVTVEDGVRPSK